MLCQLLATGGTIAMRADPATGAAVPALSGDDLLAAVPGLGAVAPVELLNVSNVPSAEMGPARWVALQRVVQRALRRSDVAGVVVTHGTDTLEDTAWFLDQTVEGDKPVVLVGAQRNASEPDGDGPRNLLAAVRTCMAPAARGRGALVVMNERILAARDAAKTHTCNVQSFAGGEAGFAGTVEGGQVRFFGAAPARRIIPLQSELLPRVDIVGMYPGVDGCQLDAAVENGARGVVVQALGLGNVNLEMFHAIGRALRAGVTVVVASRVPHGRVAPTYGFPGGGHTLREAGALFAGGLSAHKARITTLLALQAAMPPSQLQSLFES